MIGLGLVLALPGAALRAADAGLVQLSGHVPAIVSRLQSQGHFVATNLNLAIGLPLRNEENLTNLLRQISDPASAHYHQYLTPRQFAEQFGPTEQDYQAVADFARQNGLKVTGTHANRMLLDVSGPSEKIEQTFHITFNTYHDSIHARDFFAPDRDPSVPSGLKIQDVSGLENYRLARPNLITKSLTTISNQVSAAKAAGKAAPYNGSGAFGLYLGNDFRNAYVPGSALNGSGQAVALLEFDGYFQSDILEYEQIAGRTNIPLQNVYVDGFNGFPGFDDVEVSLDIEMAVAMDPALAQIIVYEAPNPSPQNDILNKIATDNLARQISCSWTWPGGPSATTDRIFQEMALQGQSFFTSAGDSDAFPAGSVDNPALQGAPADSPYVTSVGGTTLTMTPNGGARISETVWNYDIYGLDGTGSSGGSSTNYPIPYWQTNVNMTLCQGSATFRNFPDVALTGDGVFVVCEGGVETGEAGTSCAAPLWAGFTALINQLETNYNRAPIGFINPALYALGNSNIYSSVFNDITTGSNTWSQSPNLYYAVSNYDLCSGLGTPNGTNLINALVGEPPFVFKQSAPQAPYGATMSALNGSSANGAWTLFVQDDVQLNSGVISNGWMITVTLGSPLGADADVGLTLNASAASVYPGSNVVFYLTVTNYGGLSTATNVVVADTLPTGVSLLSSNVSLGSVTRSGALVNWSVGTLITNAGASLALTVASPTTAGSIIDSATVQSETPDPNPADAAASVTVNVAVPTPAQIAGAYTGGNGAFTLTITGTTNSEIIQASTNLMNWVPIYTNLAPYSFTDPKKTNFPYRFYRAVTGP